MHFKLTFKMVRTKNFENRKLLWISYLNSNTFHVEFFFRFESMQKLFKFIFKLSFQKIAHEILKFWALEREKLTSSTGWCHHPVLEVIWRALGVCVRNNL